MEFQELLLSLFHGNGHGNGMLEAGGVGGVAGDGNADEFDYTAKP